MDFHSVSCHTAFISLASLGHPFLFNLSEFLRDLFRRLFKILPIPTHFILTVTLKGSMFNIYLRKEGIWIKRSRIADLLSRTHRIEIVSLLFPSSQHYAILIHSEWACLQWQLLNRHLPVLSPDSDMCAVRIACLTSLDASLFRHRTSLSVLKIKVHTQQTLWDQWLYLNYH